MVNIGVILPCSNDGFIRRFFNILKYENFYIDEYGVNFIVVYADRNFKKIFKNNGVESIVIMTDDIIDKTGFEVLDGTEVFRKNVVNYIRKLSKEFQTECSVAVVDRLLSLDAENISDKLCDICRNLTVVTGAAESAEILAEKIFEKHGAVIQIREDYSPEDCDIMVVLDDFEGGYGNNCIVLNRKREQIIKDLYIPFKVKPPFGMSNLIFAQCIQKSC